MHKPGPKWATSAETPPMPPSSHPAEEVVRYLPMISEGTFLPEEVVSRFVLEACGNFGPDNMTFKEVCGVVAKAFQTRMSGELIYEWGFAAGKAFQKKRDSEWQAGYAEAKKDRSSE